MCRPLTGLQQPNIFGHTKRLLAVVVVMLLCPLSVPSQSPIPKPPQARSWETKGRSLIQAGSFEKALKFFRQIKLTNPEDPRPYFYCGIALMELGRLSLAASELDEAVRLGPDKPEYSLFKANVQSRLGQKDLASTSLQVFSNPAQIGKLSPAWTWILADVYYRCHKPDDSLRVLDLLTKRTPADSKVDLGRGQAFLLKGDAGQARKAFESSLRKNSTNNPAAYYELGKVLHQSSEIPAAKKALESAFRQAPGNPEYAYKLATVCLALNQDAEAFRHLQSVERSASEHPEIYYALARACRKLGKNSEAEAYARKFEESNSSSRKRNDRDREASKLTALGEKQLDASNPVEARRLFEQALAVDPQDWSAHGYLAEMLLDSDEEWEKAYTHLVKMEESEPDSVVGSYLMARYWFRRSDFAQSRDYAERAKALRPANSELRHLLGQIYSQLNLGQEALSEYEAAVRLAPSQAEYKKDLDRLKASLEDLKKQ